MPRLLVLSVFVLLFPFTVFAADCSLSHYDSLVSEGKKADADRLWDRSVAAYGTIVTDCRSLIGQDDLAKAYDALSVGEIMQEKFTAAIDSAKKCLEQDPLYNACMMTAARSYEGLGDREMAVEFARKAVEAGNHDEYSAAVAIYAKDFLKRVEKQ